LLLLLLLLLPADGLLPSWLPLLLPMALLQHLLKPNLCHYLSY
jgi:hypothetical protein